ETNAKCVEYYRYQGELYCSVTVQNKQTIDPNIKDQERQEIIFDDRPWQLAWGKVTPNMTTIEYVPAGESIEQWNELITSQFIPNVQDNISLKAYVNQVINNLQKSGFKPIIKIFKETDNQILFEFRIESPKNFKQDELQLVTKGKSGLYILH